jgi:hypothetical protein
MSESISNNDGPAFPVTLDHRGAVGAYGMSLRQWFEGQAISGLCANPELFKALSGMDKEIISTMAKGIADSMIGGAK